MADAPPPNNERDAKGRFAPGNPGGPGNPNAQRAAALRRALQEAIEPQHVSAVMRKALLMALEGDNPSMRFVFDRLFGRPREDARDATLTPLPMPSLDTAAGCMEATSWIARGLAQGELDAETAQVLLEAVQLNSRMIEMVHIENRSRQIDQQLGLTDPTWIQDP